MEKGHRLFGYATTITLAYFTKERQSLQDKITPLLQKLWLH